MRLHETGPSVSCSRRHHQLIRCILSLGSTAITFFSLARQGAIPYYPIAIASVICGSCSHFQRANSSQCRCA
jgi:hypothetical protein